MPTDGDNDRREGRGPKALSKAGHPFTPGRFPIS